METNNGYEIRGSRKFILGLVFAVGVLICGTALLWFDKISGEEWNDGIRTACIAISVVVGANAVQKFSKGGGE